MQKQALQQQRPSRNEKILRGEDMLLLVSREEGESEAKETSGDTRDSWRQFINE